MLGNIVKYGAICICGVIVGWTLCVFFEDKSLYTLDWSIGMQDVLGIIIDIALACVIAQVLEKRLSSDRVEKDHFLLELDAVNEILSGLEKTCAQGAPMSLHNTVYDIQRVKKILNRLWKNVDVSNHSFCKSNQKDYNIVLEKIKGVNTLLTDTSANLPSGITPVRISRNHIYVNGTIKPMINQSISDIKDSIFQLKLSINKM